MRPRKGTRTDQIKNEAKDPMYFHPSALLGSKYKHPNFFNGVTDPLLKAAQDQKDKEKDPENEFKQPAPK